MSEACKKILQEMDPVQFDRLGWATGIDMFELLNTFDQNDESHVSMMSHFIQSTAHILSSSENREMHRICKRLILALAELGDPEDMILNLTEEMEFEEEADTREIIVLIDVCKVVLRRFHKRDHRPIEWCLNAILRHINDQTELPEEHNLEGKEKLFLDSDPNVAVIDSLYAKLIDFSEFILDEIVPNLNVSTKDEIEFKDSILFFLLKILGKPMAYMDLEIHGEDNTKNSFRNYCETIIGLVSQFGSNLLRFVDCSDCRVEHGELIIDSNYTYLSLGVFYYLIFNEKVRYSEMPLVYDPVYLFRCCLEQVLVLLEISANLVQRKGLLLCSALLERIEPYGLKKAYVSSSSLSKLSEVLPGIMVYSEFKENRQLAVKVFQRFINCLDSDGRYTVLLNIPRVNNNSGFIGFVTTLVKDIIVSYLSTDDKRDMQFFSGKLFNDVLKNLAKLLQGVETDIAENSDRIISVLNLLRYLLLRDKNNESGILDCMVWIKADFLIPLKKAIDLSKAHYELELKNTEKGNPETPFSISVGGQTLPNLSLDEKRNILHNAINTFDLIDSLRVRVIECIETCDINH